MRIFRHNIRIQAKWMRDNSICLFYVFLVFLECHNKYQVTYYVQRWKITVIMIYTGWEGKFEPSISVKYSKIWALTSSRPSAISWGFFGNLTFQPSNIAKLMLFIPFFVNYPWVLPKNYCCFTKINPNMQGKLLEE